MEQLPEMTITDLVTGETSPVQAETLEVHIVELAYTRWPDGGVTYRFRGMPDHFVCGSAATTEEMFETFNRYAAGAR